MNTPSSPAPSAGTDARVQFGAETSAVVSQPPSTKLALSLPLLAGAPEEALLPGARLGGDRNGFATFEREGLLAGFAVAAPSDRPDAAAADLYRRLFTITKHLHLYRIWNYVPQINATVHDLENYRLFCRGRSLAFERHFGADFQKLLPAASAVGATAGPLAVGFLAGVAKPSHFENPRQVPAFEYPADYGPRPPSFARATLVPSELGRQLFVSGTAAIVGHTSMADGDLEGQLTLTLENLHLIGETAGAGPHFGASSWHRRFKVYLRHAADLPATRAHLLRNLLQPGDALQCLQADICRAELLVEIEAVLEERSQAPR